MSVRYTYACTGSVLESFATASKRDREELLRIFSRLAADPFQKGDHRQQDPAGRDYEIKRFRKWLISYWPDHPVTELRIIDIQLIVS